MRLSRWEGVRLRVYVASLCWLLVAATSFGTATVMSGMAISEFGQTVGKGQSIVAVQVASRIDAAMASRSATAAALTRIQGITDPEVARPILDALVAQDPGLSWAGILDAEGLVRVGSGRHLEGQLMGEASRGSAGLSRQTVPGQPGEPAMNSMHIMAGNGWKGRFIDVAQPIMEGDRVVGRLVISFWSGWANTVLDASRLASDVREEASSVLALDDRRVVVLGPESLIGMRLPESALPSQDNGSALSARSAAPERWRAQQWPDGQWIVGYAESRTLGWRILARQRADVVSNRASMIERDALLTGLVFAALFGAIGWVGATKVSESLRNLATAADEFRRTGEVSIPRSRIAIREISMLGRSLRDLMAKLRNEQRVAASMRNEAWRDALTEIGNRRAFEHNIVNRIQSRCGALVLLDLDGFKLVNDRHGHAAGDEVLRTVAHRISSEIRLDDATDQAFRIGGDEFALTLGTDVDEIRAMAVVSRVLMSVSEPITIHGGTEVSVGCSAGICLIRGVTTPAEMSDRADKALYAAKAAGKGIALVAPPIPLPSPTSPAVQEAEAL